MERLAGFDAAFLSLESATNHMHVASLLVADPGAAAGDWSFEGVSDLVRRRLPLVPPFRRRLVPVPFGVHHPLWADVADVDLGFHVRRAALPFPGGRRELADAVADVMGRPLDRTRPLWELHVIDGLEDGLVAAVIKVHHCAADGISGTALLARLLDRHEHVDTEDGVEVAVGAGPVTSDAELVRDAVDALPGGDALVRAVRGTVATVSAVRRRNQAGGEPPPPSPFSAPRTSLNVRIGPGRRVAWARLPMADVKAVTAVLGGSANDVVLALVARALRSYLAGRGEHPDGDLVALVPVAARASSQRGSPANRLSPMLVSLATGAPGAVDRMRAITAGTARARQQDRLVEPDLLARWAELVPPAVARPAARLGAGLLSGGALAPAANVVVSNVPGPRRPVFLAGAPVEAVYPLGPVVDTLALNVTVMTYQGHLHVGALADRDAVPDVGVITGAMEPALEELKQDAESAARR